jgi:hypothetical protein
MDIASQLLFWSYMLDVAARRVRYSIANLLGMRAGSFTVTSTGCKTFRRKSAQFCATRRESEMTETPNFRNAVKTRAIR